jgi:hypothetical protein
MQGIGCCCRPASRHMPVSHTCCVARSVLQAGVLPELRRTLLVGARYLMDCHLANGSFVAQVLWSTHAGCQQAGSWEGHTPALGVNAR